ncbi:MAG TPA: bifunctional glutamate N-acetyltransferase/amino-acid acetyltransferase ArgJ [Actinomycetota bacterium]
MKLPGGFAAAGVACGLKSRGGLDLGLLVSDRPTTAAGVVTGNRVKAAPVLLTKRLLRTGSARGIVVNAGNANACTGRQGILDAQQMGAAAARAATTHRRQMLVASTGIIGVPMDMDAAVRGIAAAADGLSPGGLDDFADAILTTDTTRKVAAASLDGGASIVGVAKGAAMIAPEMATMLCFIATDAPVDRTVLTSSLTAAMPDSFNAISVDGCMSTNDCVLVLANGAAGGEPITLEDARADAFAEALRGVCARLARAIVEDGEGATKVVTIRVDGAVNPKEAKRAASTVASSVLLRCALHGADPNWGRVLAALGTSGIPFDPNLIDVWIGGEQLCARSAPGPGDGGRARLALLEREVEVRVEMNRGGASATVLTNDLSAEYVRLNAEYTT